MYRGKAKLQRIMTVLIAGAVQGEVYKGIMRWSKSGESAAYKCMCMFVEALNYNKRVIKVYQGMHRKGYLDRN